MSASTVCSWYGSTRLYANYFWKNLSAEFNQNAVYIKTLCILVIVYLWIESGWYFRLLYVYVWLSFLFTIVSGFSLSWGYLLIWYHSYNDFYSKVCTGKMFYIYNYPREMMYNPITRNYIFWSLYVKMSIPITHHI